MKIFRKAWAIAFLVLTVAFMGYCGWQWLKQDVTGPVISGGGDRIEVSIYDGEEVLLKGITASDKKDGDVTKSLMVEKISPFINNVRTVTIVAFDSDDHISKVEREIVYTDYVSPRFEMTGSLRFRAGEILNIDEIMKVNDCLDGDLTNKIKILSNTSINNRVTGLYSIVYEVNNSAGDHVTLPVDVEIYEPFTNEVELKLDRYLVYYDGEEIPYKDFLVSLRQGNVEYAFDDSGEDPNKIPKSRVQVTDGVNYEEPGVYPVYYYYRVEHERYTTEGTEVLYVVVE